MLDNHDLLTSLARHTHAAHHLEPYICHLMSKHHAKHGICTATPLSCIYYVNTNILLPAIFLVKPFKKALLTTRIEEIARGQMPYGGRTELSVMGSLVAFKELR